VSSFFALTIINIMRTEKGVKYNNIAINYLFANDIRAKTKPEGFAKIVK
jgi:hypothetical protein